MAEVTGDNRTQTENVQEPHEVQEFVTRSLYQKQGRFQPIILDNHSYGRGEPFRWKPKVRKSIDTSPNRSTRSKHWIQSFKQMNQLQHSHVAKRWVPRKLLELQGYYNGATQLWLPKTKSTPKMQTLPQPQVLNVRQLKDTANNEIQPTPLNTTDQKAEQQTVALFTPTRVLQIKAL